MSGRRLYAALAAAVLACAPAVAQELGIPQASDTAARTGDRANRADTTWLMAAVAPGLPDRLSIFRSDDGTTFVTQASEAYAPPRGMLREPALVRHDGQYRVAYVAGAGNEIGLARSSDLKHWTFERTVPMPGPARAPRWVRARDGGLRLVVALPRGPALLAPEAAPAPLALTGLQDKYEDAAVVADGDGYVALARRRADGILELAWARDLAGPWTIERTLDALGRAAPGVGLARRPDGSWRAVFADAAGHAWQADSADGMKTWSAKRPLAGVAAGVAAPDVLADRAQDVAAAVRPRGKPRQVGWDPYSLTVGGKRVVVWSGEIHPFRLPDPAQWRDVIQKMKAVGFNGVSFYFDWGYHSPAPGVYDFSGVRNVERALEIAEEEGMYVIARMGPYVNAELSGGGFPGWMFRNRAEARTDDPAYLAAVDEWMTQIDAIIARHQATTGGGTVIAYQLENELGKVEPKHVRQMAHLAAKARTDGITVPLFHNAAGRLPDWTPTASSAPWANPGPVDLYAFDGYPGGACDVHANPAGPNKAPDWGIYATPGPKAGALSSPGTPGFVAEIGAGWFDYWGSNGTYACTAERQGKGYQRVFYGTNLMNRITLHNIYMAFGGTSWGWLPGPIVYTSYDYGAPIAEDRGLRPKALALKQQGMFVQAAGPVLARMDKGPEIRTTNPRVRLYHNVNTELGTHVLFAVHGPSDLLTDDAFSFDVATSDGTYTIASLLNGQDAKMLLADYALERQHLVYATSELQAQLRDGARDVVLLHGRDGENGETVLRYASAPKVEVLAGDVRTAFDAARGDLKLAYAHTGLARVRITGGGRAPLLLLIADEGTSQRFWMQETPAGRVLELTPALVRTARIEGGRLHLTGDTAAASPLEIWGPDIAHVSFNGAALATARQPDGSLRSMEPLAGPAPVSVPDLRTAAWTRRMDSPEAQPGFDDGTWVQADNRPSAAQTWTLPERGQPTLAMSDYGFHHGDVWYRGRFDTSDPAANRLELFYGGGGAGMLQAWVDGRFLGQHELDTGRSFPETTDTVRFDLGKLAPGPHVVAVMVRNDSHNWDLMADDAHREARGLIAASLTSRGGRRFAVPIRWRIQGNQGGEDIADRVRGPYNDGGLYGERAGWHLPGAPGQGWTPARPGDAPPAPGTYWLRTQVKLDLPRGHDVQLGLAFGDTTRPRSGRENRALVFVNGWNVGQFIAHVGPQRVFVIPPGILHPQGDNTIALAVTTDGDSANALEPVRLEVLRAVHGGVSGDAVKGQAGP
ncbi:cellulase family glycosylhydrolase [Massilia sp. NEAU-DD11]|uniref:beta-galactosidase n=1 Tax=Massilia cellulosiltytica TaxID=2683234 RepID=A0A7X3K7K1_9BURK|nr:beta-galactosidase [Telluria cellulosilytica]MVW59986.1 cellulase family glycosylhydrolase [Telluria cellulosilytica]